MSRIASRLLALAGLLALIAPSAVFAQGVLIDVRPDHRWRMPRPIIRPRPLPPTSYKIKEVAVNATVNDQVAKVQVSQTFVNTGSRQMEVCFVFPLPYDGAVDQLTLMVDGKEYAFPKLPPEIIAIRQAGGLLNYVRNELQERGTR